MEKWTYRQIERQRYKYTYIFADKYTDRWTDSTDVIKFNKLKRDGWQTGYQRKIASTTLL